MGDGVEEQAPRGPVALVRKTWFNLSREKKCVILREFEDAYDNSPEGAFGSDRQADAALFWLVLRGQGSGGWRTFDDEFARLRGKLTLVFQRQEPFLGAVTRLAADPATVAPKEVLKEIKRGDKKGYDALMVRQNAAFSAFYNWVKAKGLKLAPYVAAFLAWLVVGRRFAVAASTRAVASRWTFIAVAAVLIVLCYWYWHGERGGRDQEKPALVEAPVTAPLRTETSAGSASDRSTHSPREGDASSLTHVMGPSAQAPGPTSEAADVDPCTLEGVRVRLLGRDAVNCGELTRSQFSAKSTNEAVACVARSYLANKEFFLVIRMSGTGDDSTVLNAFLGRRDGSALRVEKYQYDSDPSGGSYTGSALYHPPMCTVAQEDDISKGSSGAQGWTCFSHDVCVSCPGNYWEVEETCVDGKLTTKSD